MAVSFVGEILHAVLPLPIPASIYGLVLMLALLMTGALKLDTVEDAGKFMIEIMPVMFIPAGVGLMESWGELKAVLVPVLVITLVSTIVVMIDTGGYPAGKETQRRGRKMTNMLCESAFFGVVISLLAYELGMLLKKKFGLPIFNPLLISIAVVIVFLAVFDIDYQNYNDGAKYLSYLLTPATVCLAIPLYEQMEALKKNIKAILAGILSGVLTSLTVVLALALIFNLNHKMYVTLLPKSITTAIGMGVSEELGGAVTITVAVIIITGVLGNMLAETLCKLFHIEEPIAKGISIGSASHAIGTAKAMEMGDVEGAMSSLSIAVAGILTVVGASIYAMFI